MKKRRKLGIAALAAVILAGLALVRWMRPYDLATEEARARAAGLPLTAAEVGIPQPPPGMDAYPLWVALQPYLHATRRTDALLRTMDRNADAYGRLNPAGLAAARQLSADTRDLDARIRQAAARPAIYWPLTYSAGGLDIKLAASLREGARDMARETQWRAAEGQWAEAAEPAGVSLRISRQAAAAPTIINCLVSVAVDAVAVDSLDKLLHVAGPNAEAARAVEHTLVANPAAYDVARALRGETVYGMNNMSGETSLAAAFLPAEPSPPSGLRRVAAGIHPPAGPWRRLFIGPSQAVYLHDMTAMVEAARRPYPARVPEMERVGHEVSTRSPHNPTGAYARRLVPVFPVVAAKAREEDARRAVLLAAAGVMAYRAAHGDWPARLTDAAPAPPTDPFTGRPVVYTRDGSGFAVAVGIRLSQLPNAASRRGLKFRYP